MRCHHVKIQISLVMQVPACGQFADLVCGQADTGETLWLLLLLLRLLVALAISYDGDCIVYRSRYNTCLERFYDGDKRDCAPPLLLLLLMPPLSSPLLPSLALMLMACGSETLDCIVDHRLETALT